MYLPSTTQVQAAAVCMHGFEEILSIPGGLLLAGLRQSLLSNRMNSYYHRNA
jgi:hypothetical protein